MISVLLNWAYIALTTICLGLGFGQFSKKVLHYSIKSLDSIIVAGLVIATVYSQVFSLFYKVGAVANLILICCCVTILIVIRKSIKMDMRQYLSEYTKIKGGMVIILVLVWAYCTSRGYIHYDTDLYHAQSIRWIEEYGIVPGLGNLHLRLAYNSSVFALSALYSMKFLVGESLHTINGFVALVLSLEALRVIKGVRQRCLQLADYARLAAIYYLTLICDEVVSPASDYLIMCTIFFIIIKWLKIMEETRDEEERIVPYSLLCVCGVFAVSLKLTAGLILLLVITPAYLLIKHKKWKEIIIFLVMGIIVIAPWVARTVVLSGYLIYPLSGLDLFDFDWEIAKHRVIHDEREIKVWGRGLNDITKIDVSFVEWMPNWFTTLLSSTEKILVIGDCVAIIMMGIIGIAAVVRKAYQKKEYTVVMFAVISSYLFWLFSAPLVRYGYAYVLLVCVLTGGYFIQKVDKRWLTNIVCVFIILIGIWKLTSLANYMLSVSGEDFYLAQKQYGSYEVIMYEINGEEFYSPIYTDRVGYDAFPSSPDGRIVEFRGDSIADGFRNCE